MSALEEVGPPAADVDEVRWLSAGEARELLTYDRDRGVLERAIAEISSRGPQIAGFFGLQGLHRASAIRNVAPAPLRAAE